MVRVARTARQSVIALALLTASVPALAVTTVQLADGTVLTIQEVRPQNRGSNSRGDSRSLIYTIEGLSASRSGVVPGTADAARDESPAMAIDPNSGDPVLIWSRFDGISMKLAWSRLEGGAWSPVHYLTFGSANDGSPAIGTTSSGSYLFWKSADLLNYAPIDLDTGRLFAAPQPIPTLGTGLRGGALGSPSGGYLRPEGGTDIPIILGDCGRSLNQPCISMRAGTLTPIDPQSFRPHVEGGSDVPVTIGIHAVTSGSTTNLAVTSKASCDVEILLVSTPGVRGTLALEFGASGNVRPLARLLVAPQVDPFEAFSRAGDLYLNGFCP